MMPGNPRMKAMTLPCRNCSVGTDQSTWKPMIAFNSVSTKMEGIWKNIIAKGQDLQCLKCLRKEFLLASPFKKGKPDKETFFRENPLARCDKCMESRHFTTF